MEVACLVWSGIVKQTSLNTTSADRSNRCLEVILIYLSQYDLKIHHIAGRQNFVPDALSRLKNCLWRASVMPANKPATLDIV